MRIAPMLHRPSRLFAAVLAAGLTACSSIASIAAIAPQREEVSAPPLTPAEACRGIDEQDRTLRVLAPREITRVDALQERTGRNPRHRRVRLAGAVMTIRAPKGMTAEWLQRILRCQSALDATAGSARPESPLALADDVVVASTDDGFAVTVRSRDEDGARSIYSLALNLKAREESDAAPMNPPPPLAVTPPAP